MAIVAIFILLSSSMNMSQGDTYETELDQDVLRSESSFPQYTDVQHDWITDAHLTEVVESFDISNDGRFFAYLTGTWPQLFPIIFDVTTRNTISLGFETDAYREVIFATNHTWLAVVNQTDVIIIDYSTQEIIDEFACDRFMRGFSFLNDDHEFICVGWRSAGGLVEVYNTTTGELVHNGTLQYPIREIAVSPNGRTIVTASRYVPTVPNIRPVTGLIQFADTRNFSYLGAITSTNQDISYEYVGFTPTGAFIVGGGENWVIVWNSTNYNRTYRLQYQNNVSVSSIDFIENSEIMLVSTTNLENNRSNIHIYQSDTFSRNGVITVDAAIKEAKFSLDGKFLSYRTWAGELIILAADLDHDLVPDYRDECPNSLDLTDDDGDGHVHFPSVQPTGCDWPDYDGDGIADKADDDDDGDGHRDSYEVECGSNPLNESSFSLDLDNDGECDLIDQDRDGDGWNNSAEIECYSDPNTFDYTPADTDGDGICDTLDSPENDGSKPTCDLIACDQKRVLSEFLEALGLLLLPLILFHLATGKLRKGRGDSD